MFDNWGVDGTRCVPRPGSSVVIDVTRYWLTPTQCNVTEGGINSLPFQALDTNITVPIPTIVIPPKTAVLINIIRNATIANASLLDAFIDLYGEETGNNYRVWVCYARKSVIWPFCSEVTLAKEFNVSLAIGD